MYLYRRRACGQLCLCDIKEEEEGVGREERVMEREKRK